ncbi:hypothetical protein HPB51_021542 [Rhipicephalus microplus]|uniref:Uncharacterized protein n=1 Tax=Rhipicephalus microplus TaxID=6941 RepID=A0A9J6EC51_RHIMP|nr:hypothetical protein HPB51_021542 [Rhipicephalus microplus]
MAAKVMRFNVAEKTMTFPTNATTDSFTRQQLESGGREFLDDVLNRDLGFMRGIPKHDSVLARAAQRTLCNDSPTRQAPRLPHAVRFRTALGSIARNARASACGSRRAFARRKRTHCDGAGE